MNTRKPPEEQLAELEKKEAQIKARIAKKKAQIRTQSRKQDTRRKIIAGALALEHAAIDPQFGTVLNRLLNDHVNREEDRKLFDL